MYTHHTQPTRVHDNELWFKSVAGHFTVLDNKELRTAFADASACSLPLCPLIPIWLRIQHKVIVFQELTRWAYSFMNLSMYPVSRWMLRMSKRLDRESENMTNFLCFERRIILSKRFRETSSAINMLAWFVILDMMSWPTAAASTLSLASDPSVYIWR